MKKVYIVGGNGFARECYLNLLWMSEINPEIQFAGFLGHGGYGHTVDYLNLQDFYLGEVSEHKFNLNEYVVIGAGAIVTKDIVESNVVVAETIIVGQVPDTLLQAGG